MPCTKCENGKYKWGKTGECEYATKEACESANHKYSKMKPTPLGKKTYEEYEKELKEFNLSKVEKIELATINELKKHLSLVEELVKSGSKITADTKSIVAGIRNMANFKKESVTVKNKAETFLDEFADAAKELGVKPMSVKEYSALDNSWDKLSKVDKEVEDSLKSIKQAL